MTQQQENDLFPLVSALCDDIATEEQNAQLQELLRTNPEARRIYLNYIDLNFELDDEFSLGRARTPLPIAPQKKSVAPWLYAAAAAIVAVGLLFLIKQKPTEETIAKAPVETPASDATTVIGRILPIQDGQIAHEHTGIDTLYAGQQINLNASPIAIELGPTRLFASGPGMLTINAMDRVTLDSGRLVAISGEGDAGFIVESPHCRVTDLGTVFTVDSGPVGTSTQVLKGSVEVTYGKKNHLLQPGKHLRVNANHKRTAVNKGDLKPYRALLELSAGGLETEGNVTPLPQPTGFLSDTIRVWPEQQNTTLPYALPATFKAPGTYRKSKKHPGGKVNAGTRVDSYLIFYRPLRRNGATRQTGVVQFPRPIIAVLCHGQALEQSDPIFVGPKRPDKVLSRTFNSEKDAITIGPDRKTIHLNLSSNAAYSNEIRVLLETE